MDSTHQHHHHDRHHDHFFGMHPTERCCCLPLKFGNKVLVILMTIWCASNLGNVFPVLFESSFWQSGFSNIIHTIGTIILYIAWLFVCFAGFRGVWREDVGACRVYYVWSYIVFLVRSISTLIIVFLVILGQATLPSNVLSQYFSDIPALDISSALFGILLQGYFVYVIFSFYHSIHKEHHQALNGKINV